MKIIIHRQIESVYLYRASVCECVCGARFVLYECGNGPLLTTAHKLNISIFLDFNVYMLFAR